MVARLIRFCRALAAALAAFADSLAQSPAPIVEHEPRFEPGEQLKLAQQAASEMQARDLLFRSLRRFSPIEPDAQA